MRRALWWGISFVALGACADRRDIAEVAAGLEPFAELRGIPFTALRSGEVRLWRKDAVPTKPIGLMETVGAYAVTYAVPVFDSTSAWPVEEAMVLEVIAERTWPSDSAAAAHAARLVGEVEAATRTSASCRIPRGDGAAAQVEFDRGDTLFLAVAQWAGDSAGGLPRTRTLLRRKSLCPR